LKIIWDLVIVIWVLSTVSPDAETEFSIPGAIIGKMILAIFHARKAFA
jgi:hypothetical protein